PRIGPGDRARPLRGYRRRPRRHPVVGAGDAAAFAPAGVAFTDHTHASAALAIKDVVVHLHALEPVEQPEDRASGVAAQDDGVVREAIATPRLSRAVAAKADRVVGAALDQDVADDVRVLADQIFVVALGADELELVVVGPFDPVVIDLVASGAALHVVAPVAVVQVAVLHPKDGVGVGRLIGRHVDLVLAVAVAAAVDLGVLEGERAGVFFGTQDALHRAVAHDAVSDRDVVGVVEHAAG